MISNILKLFKDCPCDANCPDGCNGCDNSICDCSVSAISFFRGYIGNFQMLTAIIKDVTENPNWNKCLDVNGASLARCIYNCGDNGDCEAACVEQFKTLTDDCPCEVCKMLSLS